MVSLGYDVDGGIDHGPGSNPPAYHLRMAVPRLTWSHENLTWSRTELILRIFAVDNGRQAWKRERYSHCITCAARAVGAFRGRNFVC
jgi:hypothetical protein